MHSAQDLIGRTFQGKFVITDVLGEGAMGIVYRGFDEATLDEVAIKVLLPALAASEDLVSRFHREAAAARRVDHEATVRVRGRGCEGGIHFLVMELLHGQSLAAVLTEARRMPEGRAARLVMQLCGALAVAHQRGVVHRDVKPENVMVIEGGGALGERLKLLDFGIAKRLDAARPGAVEDSFSSGDETRHGALIGTPEYMAPEQCMGREVDQRTDVYACGVLLYRMVTGVVPFDGENAHPLELCQRHIGEDPVPPREHAPWVSAAMEAIILKALRKAPDARHQSAGELAGELASVLAGIAQIEAERTVPLNLDDLGLSPQASFLAADLAAPAPVEPVLADPALADPALAGPARDDDDLCPIVAIRPIVIPAAAPLFVRPLGASLDEAPPRISRPRRRGGLSGYLPTVALAAVIGVGLGSLLVALSPFVQR